MKKLVYVLSVVIAMSSCKKEKAAPPEPDPVNVVTTIDSANISGFLRVQDSVWIQNNNTLLRTDTLIQAEFMDVSVPNNPVPVTANSLSVNGVNVPYSPIYYYKSSLPGKKIIPATWDIKGKGTIPDFTYTNLNGMPVYNNYQSLPSVIDTKQDLTILLNGFTNTRYVIVSLIDSAFGGSIYGTTPGKSAVFFASQLAKLKSNPNVVLEIRYENVNYQNLGGKTFAFINQTFLRKRVTLQ